MGEASRRKTLVEDVRKKVGDQAAVVLQDVQGELEQLRLQHTAFRFAMETFRREVAEAKAAPAELRRDVRAFQGDLIMKAEQLEALGMRIAELDRRKELLLLFGNDAALLTRLERLERLTFLQRLRHLVTGQLPSLGRDGAGSEVG